MYPKLAMIAGALTILTACAPVDRADGTDGVGASQQDQSPQAGISVSGLAYVGVTHRSN
jgi:hypothetical protein